MLPNPQETANLVTFTEEFLNENFIFCAVSTKIYLCWSHICSNLPFDLWNWESLTVIPEFNFQQFLFVEYYIILFFVLTY